MSGTPTFPQLDASSYGSQVFWLVICFVILYFFVKRFYIPRVTANLENRLAYIKRNKMDAENAESAAQSLRDAQDARLAQDKQEATRMVNNALHDAQEMVDNAKTEARRSSIETIEDAERRMQEVALFEENALREWSANMVKELYNKTTGSYPQISEEELLHLVANTYAKLRGGHGNQ